MITIVIPVYNRKDFTKSCLQALRKQTFKDFDIVVVDDGSTDGTFELLKTEFPEVKVLSGNGKLYWTAATNMGVNYALKNNADYIMTLNNDTVPFDDFLENMVKWVKKKPNALLGAFAVDFISKKPVFGGKILNWNNAEVKSLLKILDPEQHVGIHEVTHFPGRGLLIPREVFKSVGLFDQKRFPHYLADYDFTHMARKSGYKVYCNHDARIYTYPEESGDKVNRNNKSLKNYYNHLFGIKGGGNLKNFTNFMLKNCPPRYILIRLINGYLRRIFGYFTK